MTDKELIKALRMRSESDLCRKAADRIAALRQAVQYANDHADAAIADMQAANARAERLEAALLLIADDAGTGTWQGNHARAALTTEASQ